MTSTPLLNISAIPCKHFGDDPFHTVVEGIAPDDPEAPFALSFGIFKAQNDSYLEADVCLWFEKGGQVFRHPLGSESPELSRTYAVQGFSLLAWEDMRYEAMRLLEKIHRDQCIGETYACAVTPHGAVLVAEGWHSVGYNYGQGAIAAALCPHGLNAHQRLVHGQALARTIEALLRFDEQGYGEDKRRKAKVTVTIDAETSVS